MQVLNEKSLVGLQMLSLSPLFVSFLTVF